MQNQINRRNFMKAGALAGITAATVPHILLSNTIKKNKLQIGLIGVGLRGTTHLTNLLSRDDVNIKAICDIDPERIEIAQKLITKFGRKKAKVYSEHETVYKELLQKEDIDGVIISTPWIWHFPMTIDAMQQKIIPAVEVAGAFSVQECWDIVTTYEETNTPIMFLENVCYRRDVMAILNMIRQNLFGEIIHCRCGYQHDLRNIKFEPGVEFGTKGIHESAWRTNHSINRNGDLYPTHGIGPVSTFLNINCGNRFVSLSSVASKTRGLHNYIVENGGEDHPNADIKFKLGDVITTTVLCANGETILITHDTNLPRPYSLGFRVQGTKGIWMKDGDMIYIEGVSPNPHQWEAAAPYLEKYDHTLWEKYEQNAEGAGHGGMDFFVLNAYIESLKREVPPPIDVYDAAAWSVITPLSENSIVEGGEPQIFPDFTKGMWMKRKPVFALDDVF